jgi:hypothetical protein
MPSNTPPPQPTPAFALATLAGVRRDGTVFDSRYYSDAVWTRFQRGKPRKMGGYQLMSDLVSGPVRDVYVDARSTMNTAHCFSPGGIERVTFDAGGSGGGVVIRTPAGFAANVDYTWQSASMFDSGGGGNAFLIGAAAPDALNIASDVAGPVYYGDLNGTGAFTAVSDGAPILVSGGCCVLQPFLFLYGSNGLIRNSNANDISAGSGWSGTFANEANVAATKIVKGLPMRGGGASPAGLFWALDSLIRVSFQNDGTTIWRYDTVSAAISMLAKNGVVEHDGVYFWPGVDRFFMYNGVVQELPNDMNLNFFYDNLNFAHRNKIWGYKVPRFGEIWWLFPFGDSTECTHAVIFNIKEKTWYDTPLTRSAGASPQIFTRPILAGGDLRLVYRLEFGSMSSGLFAIGQNVYTAEPATPGTPKSRGVVRRLTTTYAEVELTNGIIPVVGQVLSNVAFGGAATSNVITSVATLELDSIWTHEKGSNRVYKSEVQAIPAAFETDRFNFMGGGPSGGAAAGPSLQTRLTRLEPDFVLSGTLRLTVRGTSYAQSEVVDSPTPYDITATTEFLTPREQRREMSLRFESNEVDGDFQMGHVLVTLEPGDERG